MGRVDLFLASSGSNPSYFKNFGVDGRGPGYSKRYGTPIKFSTHKRRSVTAWIKIKEVYAPWKK